MLDRPRLTSIEVANQPETAYDKNWMPKILPPTIHYPLP
jgi:hypothetical protein